MKTQTKYVLDFLTEVIEGEMARQDKRRDEREDDARKLGEKTTLNVSLHYIDGLIDGLRFARNAVGAVAEKGRMNED